MRNVFFFVLFCMIAPIGYIVGLASHPNYAQVSVQKKAVLAINSAFPNEQSTSNDENSRSVIVKSQANVDLPPLDTVTVRSSTGNPLEQGKIINIPQSLNNAQTKSRITNIDIDSFEDISMPPPTDELSIEVMGENTKNPISDDSIDTTPFIKKKETPKQEKKLTDLYADQRKKLPKAPIDGYFRKSAIGKLPISLPNRIPLYQAYGSTVTLQSNKKNLGFIIGGLGLDHELTIEAIKTLPPHVTLGFVPYSPNLQSYIDMARDFGHESILEIPMESNDFPRNDAGDHALLVKDSPQEYKRKIEWLLSRATGYSGVMNYLGNKYLSNPSSEQFFETIKQAGLYFIENPMQGASNHDMALDLPYRKSNILFDRELSADFMVSELTKSESLKNPIIVGYASKLTLNLMRNYITSYNQKNIQIIPIHKII